MVDISGKDVLDLGPSPVDALMYARHARSWTCVDSDSGVLAECDCHVPGIVPVLADLGAPLPIFDACIDVVLDFSTGDHLRDRDVMRREVYRVLRPGGRYLVTYPNRNFFDAPLGTVGGYEYRFTPEEIEGELQAAGFEISLHRADGKRSGLIAWKP